MAGALAVAFRLAQPPEIEPTALAAPEAPAAPARAEAPPPPATPGSLLRPAAPAPLIAGRPGPDAPPATLPENSPSLVPLR